jgi:hypothetical protein
MQAIGPEGELISEAREKAKEIIENASLNTQFLIGTNEMSGREERLLNKREAFEKIDEIELSPLVQGLNEVLDWQHQILDKINNDTPTQVNYFIFSDFQKRNNTEVQKKHASTKYFPTRLIAEKTSNIYVDSVWFSQPIHRKGTSNELNVRIVNSNSVDIENLEVDINIGDYTNQFYVTAPANKKTTTKVSYIEKSNGSKSGSVKVSDDNVHFDDTYYISYEVIKHTDVLLLNGDDAIEGPNTLFELNEAYTSKNIDITSVTLDEIEQADLVVLNGVNKISSGLENYLSKFRSSGGSILLFPGKTPDRSSWNQLLKKCKLPIIGSGVSSGNRIRSLNYKDPFYDGVFEEETDELNLPGVSKTYQAIASNSRSNNLITLQNGLPLLSYSRELGTSYMFYSSVHEDYGNFSKDALFTTILLRAAELSSRQQPLSLTIGSSAQYPVYNQINGDQEIHVKGKNIDIIPLRTELSGVNYISLNKMNDFTQLLAGNYTIETDKPLGVLSLNYDRSESELSYLNKDEISELFKNNTYAYNEISSDSELSTNDLNKPFGYWKICIVLTLIFVLTEMLLIRILK